MYYRFGNKLVLVASQALRNFFLIKHDVNPSFELSDVSYCLLERIGRSRRCGELSLALNFMKNGANPTYYFWNKLRRRKIIKTQVSMKVPILLILNLNFRSYIKKY